MQSISLAGALEVLEAAIIRDVVTTYEDAYNVFSLLYEKSRLSAEEVIRIQALFLNNGKTISLEDFSNDGSDDYDYSSSYC